MPADRCRAWLCPLPCRPYFLPCLVSAAMSAVALLMVLLWLEETLPKLRKAQYAAVPAAEAAGGLVNGRGSGSGGVAGNVSLARPELEMGALQSAAKKAAGSSQADEPEEGLIASSPGVGAVQQSGCSTDSSGSSCAVRHPHRALSGDSAASLRLEGAGKSASSAGSAQLPGAGADSWEALDEELALLGGPREQEAAAAGVEGAEKQGGSSSGLEGPGGAPERVWWKQRGVLLALTGYGERGGAAAGLAFGGDE